MANKKNRQQSLPNSSGHVFTVGDGVHWGFNADRSPGTVMAISDSGRVVYVSEDDFVATKPTPPQEGDIDGTFTTRVAPIEQCKAFKLLKDGTFKSSHVVLRPERRFARNPSI